VQQVLDDRCGVCFGWIGLDVRKSGPAEPAKDEMNIRVKEWDEGRIGHDARSPDYRHKVWFPPQRGSGKN
jgi:hypothetical protein